MSLPNFGDWVSGGSIPDLSGWGFDGISIPFGNFNVPNFNLFSVSDGEGNMCAWQSNLPGCETAWPNFKLPEIILDHSETHF